MIPVARHMAAPIRTDDTKTEEIGRTGGKSGIDLGVMPIIIRSEPRIGVINKRSDDIK